MSADTIMMIHGMWGTESVWANYVDFFERKGYKCITPTLPFHDVNPIDPPNDTIRTTSLLDYVEFIEGEIKRLDEPPIIVGHSMGGLISQMIGARGLAKALVLIAPAPPRGIFFINYSTVKSLSEVVLRPRFWNKPHRPSYKNAVYSQLHLLPIDRQREVYKAFVFDSGRALFEIAVWYLDLKKSTKVSHITCPILAVSGSQDRLIPAKLVRKIANKYDAEYKEFPNHAHRIIDEPGWADVSDFVYDWINTVVQSKNESISN